MAPPGQVFSPSPLSLPSQYALPCSEDKTIHPSASPDLPQYDTHLRFVVACRTVARTSPESRHFGHVPLVPKVQ